MQYSVGYSSIGSTASAQERASLGTQARIMSQGDELHRPWTWQELQVAATNAVHRSVKDYARRLLELSADRWEHLLGHIPSDQPAQDPYPLYEITDAQVDAIAHEALRRPRGPKLYNRTNVRAAVNIALATRRRQK